MYNFSDADFKHAPSDELVIGVSDFAACGVNFRNGPSDEPFIFLQTIFMFE